MMETTNLFKINDAPMLMPDSGVGFSYADMEDGESGTDEAGYLHRIVTRYKVGTWSFSYSGLTEEEKQYLDSLLPDAPSFAFTRPSRADAAVPVTTRCYCSKYGIAWKNARTGLWSGCSFEITEC